MRSNWDRNSYDSLDIKLSEAKCGNIEPRRHDPRHHHASDGATLIMQMEWGDHQWLSLDPCSDS